ncbi:MAG TPA: response regulator [Anaerolineae bacterium]|nr:response regulator [Anaerolineae bacterium]
MLKILIADDDRATSTLLRTLFEIEGYTGVVCPRPEDVLSVARHEQPNLLLMDVHLASVDSITILKQIRLDANLKKMPVVMISGMDMEDKCLRAGASAFVMKPFRPTDLLNEIKRVLNAPKN